MSKFDEWSVMVSLVEANNSGDFDKFFKIVSENDFSLLPRAAEVVVSCAELTVVSVRENLDVMSNFAKSVNPEDLSFRDSFRFSFLTALIDDAESNQQRSKL